MKAKEARQRVDDLWSAWLDVKGYFNHRTKKGYIWWEIIDTQKKLFNCVENMKDLLDLTIQRQKKDG